MMWQQFLMKAMEGGNKTCNNAFAASSRNGDKAKNQELGGMPKRANDMGLEAMGGESKEQGGATNTDFGNSVRNVSNPGAGFGNMQIGGMGGGQTFGGWNSDERAKEKTPNTTDMIAEVAEYINNYTYHYKPGIGENPSIEYSGPMAQELLQVDGYRSCVFEDESGMLQVDTGRLAMVNAGMIADLSKRLLMLETFIQSVMAGLGQEQVMPDVE
jgi:hypothetical protein